MADLTITAANVVAGENAEFEYGVAGEAIIAGKTVYRSSATGRFMLADTNAVAAETRKSRGIASNAAAAGQPLTVQKRGDIVIGATLVAGAAYYGSDTPGGICPVADVGAGEAVCQLGIAKSTTVLSLNIQFPGVTL